MFRVLTLVVCILFARQSYAYLENPENKKYNEYYTVSEKVPKVTTSVNPMETLQNFLNESEFLSTLKGQILNLLNFEYHKEIFAPTEPYERFKHFGTWLRDSKTCLNTRAVVLVRDSQEEVTYSAGGKGCTVATGIWHDPYTDKDYRSSKDIQIDHVVALKNAYVSGASKWNNQQRCLFANFLGNDFHLLSVNGTENMKKSDRGPEGYMPPSQSYQCEYLQTWVSIKLIWGLGLNPNEAQAVRQLIKSNQCKTKDFVFSVAYLQQQRTYIQDNLSICRNH